MKDTEPLNNKPMRQSLAIIIPAYKSIYLEDTLTSLANQTDKDFSLYIGDDGSPENLDEIIQPFSQILDITYVRFEENVGRRLLPEHWNRCLELIREEEWIWLFSDDDLAGPECVGNFKSFAAAHPACRLFKFDSVKFRDDEVLKNNTFPAVTSPADFLRLKLGYTYESYAIEFIFHRSILPENKFPLLPLGWCSDDLFWLTLSLVSDIYTIPHTHVYWRYSEHNISGRKNNRQSSLAKLKACSLFLPALFRLFASYLNWETYTLSLSWFDSQYQYLSRHLTRQDKIKIKIARLSLCARGLLSMLTSKKPASRPQTTGLPPLPKPF